MEKPVATADMTCGHDHRRRHARARSIEVTADTTPPSRVYYRRHNTSMGATKARNRACLFEVLVHRNKHRGGYGPAVTPALGTAAGALAVSDGVLHTASTIGREANADGRQEVVEIASVCLVEIVGEVGQQAPAASTISANGLVSTRHSFEFSLHLNARRCRRADDASDSSISVAKHRFAGSNRHARCRRQQGGEFVCADFGRDPVGRNRDRF